jgi:hypothetical protein
VHLPFPWPKGINHTSFFLCPLARYVWNIVSCVAGVNLHFTNVEYYISSWLRSYGNKIKNLIAVGVADILWSI